MNKFRLIMIQVLGIALVPFLVAGQDLQSGNRPLLFSANEVTHDKKSGIVRAIGNVEVSHEQRVLIANSVTYNQLQDVVTATGGVSLLEASGDVLFAETMKLTGDLKDGIIRDLRIRLSDNSRIAATGARRSGGISTEMRNAVYSPCQDCADQTNDKPLWQLKAKKVVHDEKEQVIEYTDAYLELFGVPIAYIPFFYHPDPTVKRKSGFIAPSFGSSSALGPTIATPYFFDIAANKDLTITPTFTSKERVHLAAEYRDINPNIQLESNASITLDSNDDLFGHIDTKYRKNVNDVWRMGIDIQRAIDDTYMRRYKISSRPDMTTRAFGEAFKGRDYLKIDSYYFQGLQETDDPGEIPIVLPMLDFSHISKPNRLGATNSITANALALTRTDGNDTKRLSLGYGWHLPRIGSLGEVLDVNLSIRGDMYHVTNLVNSNGQGSNKGISGRIHPQASVNWGYPMSNSRGRVTQTLEPLASLIINPYGGNSDDIPNEDSVDFEFDDTNVFSENRFTGLDRVEGGPRLGYGIKWGAYGQNGGSSSLFVGQSYRIKSDDTFGPGSGLEDNFSDIVSRINISPGKYFDLNYRTRLSHEDLSPSKNEVQLAAGPPALRATTNYVFFESQPNSEFGGRDELSGSIKSQLNRLWRSSLSGRYNLQDEGNLQAIALNATFECECFTFSTTLKRDFFVDRDLKPSDTILFQLTFKTLGESKFGVSKDG